MGLMSILQSIGPLLADCEGDFSVTLIGRYEFDAAMPVPIVVPIHKGSYPLARLAFACKWPARVVGPVHDSLEQGF